MTDHDTGGTLNGWDDELNDWTEDDRVTDQAASEAATMDRFAEEFRQVNAQLAAAHDAHLNLVVRFDAYRKRSASATDRIVADAVNAQTAGTGRGYCDEAP